MELSAMKDGYPINCSGGELDGIMKLKCSEPEGSIFGSLYSDVTKIHRDMFRELIEIAKPHGIIKANLEMCNCQKKVG
jgi:hypothetical protein